MLLYCALKSDRQNERRIEHEWEGMHTCIKCGQQETHACLWTGQNLLKLQVELLSKYCHLVTLLSLRPIFVRLHHDTETKRDLWLNNTRAMRRALVQTKKKNGNKEKKKMKKTTNGMPPASNGASNSITHTICYSVSAALAFAGAYFIGGAGVATSLSLSQKQFARTYFWLNLLFSCAVHTSTTIYNTNNNSYQREFGAMCEEVMVWHATTA